MTMYPVNMSSVSEVYFFRSICVKMCSSSKGRPFVTWWRLQILPKERRSSPSRSNSHKSIMLNGYLEVMLLVANTVQRRSSSLVFFLRRMQSNDVIPYNALIGDSSWRFELSQQSSGIVFFFSPLRGRTCRFKSVQNSKQAAVLVPTSKWTNISLRNPL